MRLALIAVLVFTGCGPRLVLNSRDMTPDEMLARSSHVFVGVVQEQELHSRPVPRLNLMPERAHEARYWRLARRQVRVETVLRGPALPPMINVYEVYWTGGATGNWNSTQDGERDLFLVLVEAGHYRVVRDWSRSIFPVTSGPHSRTPLDDSRPLWERIALMNWWMERPEINGIAFPGFTYNDPGGKLGQWREAKLLRGLLRHPRQAIRLAACHELLPTGWGQDECWEQLSAEEKAQLSRKDSCCSAEEIAEARRNLRERGSAFWWGAYSNRDERRLLTAVSDARLRAEFCRLYEREYPGDADSGCPADRPPPATMVTADGDVPLLGAWPMEGR